jgi:Uma2 family endonuclease
MVMEAQKQKLTIAEFHEFCALPENQDRLFELIHGEIVEKHAPYRYMHSPNVLTVAESKDVPDLYIGIKSIDGSKRRSRLKAEDYLIHGTKLVWLVFPEEQLVEVYSPDQEDVIIIGIDGVLDGGDVLPGFSLPVAKIFA